VTPKVVKKSEARRRGKGKGKGSSAAPKGGGGAGRRASVELGADEMAALLSPTKEKPSSKRYVGGGEPAPGVSIYDTVPFWLRFTYDTPVLIKKY
jgi:hypothetical protein